LVAVTRPRERVPQKMPTVTASTATWPRTVPEQLATAMGAMAAMHQGVSFMRESSPGARSSRERHAPEGGYDIERHPTLPVKTSTDVEAEQARK
jgi:hypothetical protein